MCGLWGVFNSRPEGTLIQNDIDMALDMAVFMSRRGDHSSGFCTIPRVSTYKVFPSTPNIARCVGSPYVIIHSRAGTDYFKWAIENGNAIFGHGRRATSGAISVKNAHPFEEGDWILVHNGTIRDGVKVNEEIEVDSHALCVKFNEVGIKDALKTVNGAYAIMAFHKPTKKMYFARNHERDLWYFRHVGMFYFMSEDFLLRAALKRNNHYYKDGNIDNPVLLPPEKLYTIEDGKLVSVDDLKKEYPKRDYYGSGTVAETKVTRDVLFARRRKKNEDEPLFIKKEELLLFKVISMAYHGENNYEYTCESSDNMDVPVVFHHKYQRPDIINKWGVVDKYTHKLVQNKPEDECIFVRYEEIDWDEEEKLIACTECAGAIKFGEGEIRTLDNKHICGECVESFMRSGGGLPKEQAAA